MRTSELFGAKNFEFFKTYGVSKQTGRLSHCDAVKGRGQFFAILCERLLWTFYNTKNAIVSSSRLKVFISVNKHGTISDMSVGLMMTTCIVESRNVGDLY